MPSRSPADRAKPILGWDLGGVHVKVALIEAGAVRAVVQAPCALWQGLAALDNALSLLPDWARVSGLRHAVTMTGELCDCFGSRTEGVDALAGWSRGRLGGDVRLYAGRAGFVTPDQAAGHAAAIASANWHATASVAGRHLPAALLVDIGSTTADLIPIAAGASAEAGYTDAERLATGELVYTGAVRTALATLTHRVPFQGRWTAVMAEAFAMTADVHRLLGTLPEAADQQEASDGRGKSTAETETRLARMIGRDRADGSGDDWARLARFFAEAQLRRLHEAALQIASRGVVPDDAPVIGCGVGRFLAERLAARLGRPYRDWATLVGDADASPWISACAPAVAVALLADAG